MESRSTILDPPDSRSFWSSVSDSLRGKEHDYTSGNLGRAILLLSVPMVLEMAMESLFGLVDVFFVAHLGSDATATVGITESILTLVFAAALGLGMATTATVARRVGEKNREGAAVAAVQSIALGIVVSILVGIVGVLEAPQLLRMMGASPAIVQTGSTYTRIMLGGSGTVFMLFLINAIFRGAGDPAIAMRVLWIANGVNIVLDPCLILGLGPFPELGVTGAAVSTTIGRSVGVLLQLWYLFSPRNTVTIRRSQIVLHVEVMKRLLRTGANGMLQYLVATASWLALVRLVSRFGADAMAGYTIAIRIIVFAILPSWGMSNAAATLVGQNLGAQRPDRAEQAVWRTGVYNMVFLGCVAVLFVAFARTIVSNFTDEPAVQEIATDCLRYVSYGYIFYAWGMVMVQAFNGAGDTLTPTLINAGCYWLWQIPLAYALSNTAMGTRGIFLAIVISESTLAVVAMLAFRRGGWKNQKV
jgi:putative MATE family efflux protein